VGKQKELREMKKLGLCVRYDCNNYGSMLQILATQKVIEKYGWDYEIIRYDKKTIGFVIKNVTRLFNPYFMRGKIMDCSKKRKMRKYPDIKMQNRDRMMLFQKYRKQFIGPYSSDFKGYRNLVKGVEQYDAVMVGSDQLWTPAGIKSKFYNLLFVPDHIKKISFATSFGVSKIPNNQLNETKRYLDRIEYLSVREMAGADVVQKLIERNVTVALDPTLMFDGNEWLEIFPKVQMSEEPYIFAYFLGKSVVHRETVESISQLTGLKIITCPQMDSFVEKDLTFGNEQRFDIDPIGFLNLIRGAEYICTDSFHGSVFSILYHKKFITFNRFNESSRQSRNSRIDSLFGLLGLQSRRYTTGMTSVLDTLNAEIDYEQVDYKLQTLRRETFGFLSRALEM